MFWTGITPFRCGLVVSGVIVVVVVGDVDGGIRSVGAVVRTIDLHADGAGELVVAAGASVSVSVYSPFFSPWKTTLPFAGVVMVVVVPAVSPAWLHGIQRPQLRYRH